MAYETRLITDRAAIREFLNRDRKRTAYAIGDLDDAFWPQSAFYGVRKDGQLISLLLLYRGLDPTVLTAFGETGGVQALCESVALPEEAYYLWPPPLEALLDALYERPHSHREWRMALNPARFRSPDLGAVTRIQPGQADVLAALYKQAAEPGEAIVAFSPWQIAHGVFFGVWSEGELVATAGTHVWSPAERVAAIGNVFTRPDVRGRGYAKMCTAAVVVEALKAGIDPVILNVRDDNAPAIHVYEMLGFEKYCLFLEGPALRRKTD